MSDPTIKKKRFSWRWLFIILFLLAGLISIFSNLGPGLFLILSAIILLPQFSAFLQKKFKFVFTTKLQVVAIVVLLILIAVIFPAKNQPAESSSNIIKRTAPSTQQAAPKTDQQKLDDTVKSLLDKDSSYSFSSKGNSIDTDDKDRPAGSKFITIDINTSTFWDGKSAVEETGMFSSDLFSKVFPINSNFYDVVIRYYGQTTDQYGNTQNSMLMSYSMDLPLFKKINWSGFSNTQNYLDLCAFLREEESTMSDDNPDKMYIGCVVSVSDIRTAENKIETSNPQDGDIPQYGN